mmetsp:Transcript_49175/g.87791  ORF Transcript_49175/g.87791 Transcript_49175/m.87791 type:complete len:223 (+) Transcript_49175:2429-3097(+)
MLVYNMAENITATGSHLRHRVGSSPTTRLLGSNSRVEATHCKMSRVDGSGRCLDATLFPMVIPTDAAAKTAMATMRVIFRARAWAAASTWAAAFRTSLSAPTVTSEASVVPTMLGLTEGSGFDRARPREKPTAAKSTAKEIWEPRACGARGGGVSIVAEGSCSPSWGTEVSRCPRGCIPVFAISEKADNGENGRRSWLARPIDALWPAGVVCWNHLAGELQD